HSSNYYAPTLTYTLSLHDALPISSLRRAQAERCKPQGNRKLRPLRLSACGLELLLTVWQSARATVSLLYGMRRAVCVTGWLMVRSEEHTSELQSLRHLVCRLLLEK